MPILFLILVVLASVLIGFFILVQNPKGGGLSGSIAGFNTQFMGVKQTTDILEKGTWIMAIVIGLLCLASAVFIAPSGSRVNEPNLRPNSSTTQPVTPAPAPAAPSQAQP